MATSGSYLQHRSLAGTRVHHILHPQSGRNPVHRVVSVTVVADSCAIADALATALMVSGADGAAQILARFADHHPRVLFLSEGERGLERRTHDW